MEYNFPSAVLLARLQDVVMNNNVLYRLVKPTEAGTQVVSVDRLVNVAPHRRIYRFDRKDELNEFCGELLRRPLVLQPIVHFGRGLGKGSLACGMCYKDDKWVMMVNQTHPRILSRLQIGLDAAKKAMASGQSFEVRFCFTKMVEKIYRKTLTKREQEAAASNLDLIKTYFRYAEWEHGDLILRYHGYAAMLGRGGGINDVNTLNLSFKFEDLQQEEICWRTLGAEFFPHPHLSPVTEDEIREVLPAWTVNGVSPLEDIGDHVPVENYSYAQAGRLYESFRKKKRKPRTNIGATATEGAPQYQPTISDGIELKVISTEGEDWHQQHDEVDEEDDHGFRRPSNGHRGDYSPSAPHVYSALNYPSAPRVYSARNYKAGAPPAGSGGQVENRYPEDDGFCEEKGARPKTYRPQGGQFDSHGHLFPKVHVSTGEQGRERKPSQGKGPSPSYNAPYPDTSLQSQFTRLRMHGSDRSSHSEAGSSGIADSGIESDGHAREGSFEKPHYNKQHAGSSPHPYAMDNMGFHHEDEAGDVSEAMRKHKELVAKMMGGAGPQTLSLESETRQHSYQDSRQQRHASQSSAKDRYYSNGNVGLPVHAPRIGVPSPKDASGKPYSYPPTSPSWGYQQNAQTSRQQVDESFI